MHLTQHTDYALRMMLYIAVNNDRLVTIDTIAQYYDISKSYLMKITATLVRNKLLESIRGKNGGIRLACHAKDINIGHIVRVMEPLALVECMGSENLCKITSHCSLSHILNNASNAFLSYLERYSLADLIDHQSTILLYDAKNNPQKAQYSKK